MRARLVSICLIGAAGDVVAAAAGERVGVVADEILEAGVAGPAALSDAGGVAARDLAAGLVVEEVVPDAIT